MVVKQGNLELRMTSEACKCHLPVGAVRTRLAVGLQHSGSTPFCGACFETPVSISWYCGNCLFSSRCRILVGGRKSFHDGCNRRSEGERQSGRSIVLTEQNPAGHIWIDKLLYRARGWRRWHGSKSMSASKSMKWPVGGFMHSSASLRNPNIHSW